MMMMMMMMEDVPAHLTDHLVLLALIQQIHVVDPDLVASQQWHRRFEPSWTPTASAVIFVFVLVLALSSPASALASPQ